VDFDVGVMDTRNCCNEAQAKAMPGSCMRVLARAAIKWTEYRFAFAGFDTWARVRDMQNSSPGVDARFQCNCAAGRRKFKRVINQVFYCAE
jgi:hypothetical protein